MPDARATTRHGPAPSPDASVVLSLVTDPEEGFADAYRQHAGSVFALARRLLADRTLAEEVTQEVFLRLWKDPGRYEAHRGSLRSYLLAHCHGRSVDLIRAESSRRSREDKTARRERSAPPDSVERAICDTDTADAVALSLEVLTEVERDAISLAFFGGYTYREVAKLLGTPEGTVKSQIRRGLQRLRTEIVNRGMGGDWPVDTA